MSILVTGKNGPLAKDIYSFFGDNYRDRRIFYMGHNDLDLTSKSDVDNFFQSYDVDYVLHTAIKGSRRIHKESYDNFYDNLLMFHNLLPYVSKLKLFINFDSMASFDRRYKIDNIEENNLIHRLPKDFYGLSKNIISRWLGDLENFLNLRIVSCFSENETEGRHIKGNILRCLDGQSMIVHQNRYFDFVYYYDVMLAIKYCIENFDGLKYRDYNVCYKNKVTLLEVLHIINSLVDNKADIVLENKELGSPITGSSKRIDGLNIDFIGLEGGIKRTFNILKGRP